MKNYEESTPKLVQNQRSGIMPILKIDNATIEPFREVNYENSDRGLAGYTSRSSSCLRPWARQTNDQPSDPTHDDLSKLQTIVNPKQLNLNHHLKNMSHRLKDNKENIQMKAPLVQSMSDATLLEGGDNSRDKVQQSEKSRSVPKYQDKGSLYPQEVQKEDLDINKSAMNFQQVKQAQSTPPQQAYSRSSQSPKVALLSRNQKGQSALIAANSNHRLNPENEAEIVTQTARRDESTSPNKDRIHNSGGGPSYRSSPYNLRSHSASPNKYGNMNVWQVKNISRFDQDDLTEDELDDSQNIQMDGESCQLNLPKNQTNSNIQKLIDEVTKKEEKWTKAQDQELVRLVSINKVERIAEVYKELNKFIEAQKLTIPIDQHHIYCQIKNEVECMDRWLVLRNNTEDGTVKQIKGNWTPEEDMILRKKVAEYGLKKWKEIATFLPGRIGKQCRERWYNNVDPNLNKEKWTIAEDLQLMELHKQYGNKWVQIQKLMPGRIDNDIKNRFNASLRKYKTFEQYLEANDRKREKSKKKYYWRQHYELRNVNNSKRLPLNDQDKQFKDMAQQKIQLEVGSNLPPLKNDIIQEKKKELEEYKEFRKLKAKVREEKRMIKLRDKISRKKTSTNQSPNKTGQFLNGSILDSQFTVSPVDGCLNQYSALTNKNYASQTAHVSHFDLNAGPGNAANQSRQPSAFLTNQASNHKDNGSKSIMTLQGIQSSSKFHQLDSIQKQIGIKSISSTHYQILMTQCKLQDPKNATYLVKQAIQLVLQKPQAGLRQIRADSNYKEHFKCFKVPRFAQTQLHCINPFVNLDTKNYRELYMPVRNENSPMGPFNDLNQYNRVDHAQYQISDPYQDQRGDQFGVYNSLQQVPQQQQEESCQQIVEKKENTYITDEREQQILDREKDQIMKKGSPLREQRNIGGDYDTHNKVRHRNSGSSKKKQGIFRPSQDQKIENQYQPEQDEQQQAPSNEESQNKNLSVKEQIIIQRRLLQQKIQSQLEKIKMLTKKQVNDQQQQIDQSKSFYITLPQKRHADEDGRQRQFQEEDKQEGDCHDLKRQRVESHEVQKLSQQNPMRILNNATSPLTENIQQDPDKNVFQNPLGKPYLHLPRVFQAPSSTQNGMKNSNILSSAQRQREHNDRNNMKNKALYFIKKPMSSIPSQDALNKQSNKNGFFKSNRQDGLGIENANLTQISNKAALIERIKLFQNSISQKNNQDYHQQSMAIRNQESEDLDRKGMMLQNKSKLINLLIHNKPQDGQRGGNGKNGDKLQSAAAHLIGIHVKKPSANAQIQQVRNSHSPPAKKRAQKDSILKQ